MKTLDVHTIWDSPIVGYGRAYKTLRAAIQRLLAGSDFLELAEPYTGGDVQLFVGCPLDENIKHFQRKAERFICLTMWESTTIPLHLVANINGFDELIVPSEWGKQVFIENGVIIPIHVIPLGIDIAEWPLQERNRTPDDKFTIIWQGSYFVEREQAELAGIPPNRTGDRKGGQEIVDAFKALNLENARLILKLNPKCSQAKIPWTLPFSIKHDIISVGEVLDQAEMLKLLARADLSVYPSYGEGFGLIPIEHMATGLPVILSDNTAMSQYCNSTFNYPISCEPKAATYGEEVGIDYIPDRGELITAIRYAYDKREFMAGMGQRAAGWVRQNWSIDKTAERIIELCLNGG